MLASIDGVVVLSLSVAMIVSAPTATLVEKVGLGLYCSNWILLFLLLQIEMALLFRYKVSLAFLRPTWRGGVKPLVFLPAASSCPYQQSYYCESHNNSSNNTQGKVLAVFASFISLGLYWKYTSYKNKQNYKEKTILNMLPLIATAKCSEKDKRRSRQFNFLAEAVETASPSVVYIERNQMYNTIFGKVVQPSCGSGFIVDENGYVLTNAHVVHNSRDIKVKLQNGRIINAVVTDIDQIADLALVKLELRKGEKVPSLQFGSSVDLRPGEWVVALGSPLALSNTITAGIVSSVHRPSAELGLSDKPDMEYVQTDAPITQGNSGGPLVNLDGEVIGINTMTAGPGISFAVPSDFAKEFLKRANKTAKHRGRRRYGIGVSMLTMSPRIAKSLQMRGLLPPGVNRGVLLANVWPGSPADHAGLMKGDVIVRINNKDIKSSSDVFEIIQSGGSLNVEIIRENIKRILVVTPEPLDS